MPSLDPSQIIFDSISSLTGGLIVDLQTLVVAALVVSFIIAGVDILISALGNVMDNLSMDRNFERAQDYLTQRDRFDRGTASWDRYNLLYRRSLRKSI